MAQATEDLNDNPSQAEQILEAIRELRQEVEQANQNTNACNQRLCNYQRATQWVVWLSFSLIVAATAMMIISTIYRRIDIVVMDAL